MDEGLEGLTEEELIERLIGAASDPEYGQTEAEYVGRAIAKLGPLGVSALERVLRHPEEHAVAGAVHGLCQIGGWPEGHTVLLRELVLDQRPAVAASALGACIGWDGSTDVCYVPDAADDVAERLARHESSDVRSMMLQYLSRCAPDRHARRLVDGLTDADPSVRWTAVGCCGRIEDPVLRAEAGSQIWLKLDDEDIDVRDWAQMFVEAHAWPLPESDGTVPMTTDEALLAYSRTRIELDPPRERSVDIRAFAEALELDRPLAVRRGAADELFEQTVLSDKVTRAALCALAETYLDDAHERVRQAMVEAVAFARNRA